MADPVSFAIATAARIGISYLFPSEGPRLKDLKMSASTYGAQIPQIFGVARVPGNMIWSDKIREHKRKKMVGKGGFSNEYTYTCSFAMAFCAGPLTQFRRLWADGKLLYDITGESEVTSEHRFSYRVYLGDENQLPDSTIEALMGEGNVPAYRGLSYVVFENMPLENFGNRIPQLTAEVYNSAGTVTSGGPFVTFESTEGGSTGYQLGQIIVDSNRGYFYLHDPLASPPVIRRIRMRDGVEDFRRGTESVNTGACLPFSYDSGQLDYPMGVNQSGYLIMQTGGVNNYVAYAMLDPNTYEIKALKGTSDAFGRECGAGNQGFQPDGGAAYSHSISINNGGRSKMGVMGLFGEFSVLDTTDPVSFSQSDATRQQVTNGLCPVAGTIGEKTCGFYAFYMNSGHTGLVIQPLGGATGPAGFIPLPPGANWQGMDSRGAIYDQTDGGVLLQYVVPNDDVAHSGQDYMYAKYSPYAKPEDGYILWKKKVPIGSVAIYSHVGNITNGQYGFALGPTSENPATMWLIDTITGDWKAMQVEQQPAFVTDTDLTDDEVVVDQDAYTGYPIEDGPLVADAFQYYDSLRGSIITLGTGGPERILRIGPDILDTAVGNIVEYLLRQGGLTSKDMDMSRLYGTKVLGYGWAATTDIKSILEELQRIFLFDIVESSGKLVGVLRSAGTNEDDVGAAVATIQQDALGSSGEDVADFWQETRIQEADLPERVTLTYMDFDNDYQASTAISTRISSPLPTMFSRQQVSMEVNIVMTATQAKTQVNKALYTQWSERTKHDTRLPWAYLPLDPADLIRVEMHDGRSYFERMHRTEIGADFTIETETYGQDSGAYEIDAVGDGGGAGPAKPIQPPGAVQGFIINTPLLRDQDDTGGSSSRYYAAIGNASPVPYVGANLQRATSLPNFAAIDTPLAEAEWGVLAGTLGPARHGHFALDWESKIKVRPVTDWFELDSITDDELWAGGNAALVGDEIIQFRDCVENVDGTWTLWNLLRGRRGTEYATHTHQIGEPFLYLLNVNSIAPEGEMIDTRGQKRYYKAVAYGRSIQETPLIDITYEPRDLMPYAPKDIRREIAGPSINVTWKRRTRMGGGMQDFTGTVPINEASEKYEVYFYDTPFVGDLSRGGDIQPGYLHTATTTTPTYTWTPDPLQFASNLDTLTVVVYQISAAVGRGFPGTRSIEPWQDF